ncbi:MAG: hypothetical protein J0J11_03165 [Microbacterium sp.]|nr:hypothetical protein [Microbacterium sp.]
MIRRETVKLTDICGSGHYGSAFSMAELIASLYYEFLHVDPKQPRWADRDRFTMGKGHAAIGLYPVLADLQAAIDGLDEVDLTSQDIAIGIKEGLEKDRWFLFAHLAE